jgi:hypothetical protein
MISPSGWHWAAPPLPAAPSLAAASRRSRRKRSTSVSSAGTQAACRNSLRRSRAAYEGARAAHGMELCDCMAGIKCILSVLRVYAHSQCFVWAKTTSTECGGGKGRLTRARTPKMLSETQTALKRQTQGYVSSLPASRAYSRHTSLAG